jgi:outer membrane usher protein
MRLLKSLSSPFCLALVCLLLARVGFGQTRLVDTQPHPGILYCSNESGGMLCTDDGAVTWHEIEYFRGRYRKAILLSNGKATDSTVVVTPPEPTPQKKLVETTPPPGPHEIVLGVQINGRPAGEFARILQLEDGKLYISTDLIAQWRLQVFQGNSVTFNGQTFYSIDALNGVHWKIDPAQQILSLTVQPSAFAPTTVNASFREAVEAARPQPGLFLNHQLVYSHLPGSDSLGGLFEAGFFSGLGVITSQFAERDFTQNIAPIRLMTKLAREFPDQMAILNIGDSITASNVWSRQVTYAGISWGSDFATRPSFVPIVLPNLAGQAAQPSTVDIYVNGVRTAQQTVDPGPFAINNIPVITGQGDIQMVVTDVLGRQQVITQSYISAQELLRPGVNAYTYEAGILRRNFGIVSSEYGSLFAEAQQRHGFTDRLTADARVEASGKQQTASVGAEYGIMPLGIIGGGFAASESPLGPGGLGYLIMQRRARLLGFSGTLQVASSTFQQLGMAPGERAPRLQAQFQVNESLGRRVAISAGYLRQENRSFLNGAQAQKPDFSGISTSASVRLGSRFYLTAAANLSHSFKNASSGLVSLVVPLGHRAIASATSTYQQGGSHNTTIEYTQQVPVGTGYGYRVRSDIGNTDRVDAGFTYQTNSGTIDIEGARTGSQTSSRITETGGAVMVGGHVAPSPWLNTAFALVDVSDLSGVKVFANNQYISRTGWRGLAVVPVLAAYIKNSVRLDDQGVPIELGIDLGEQTIVPRSRTGVLVKFKAVRMNGALFQLVTEKGDPVPVGAEVTLGEFGTIYNVALRGEVFISNISFPAHLHARWADQRCDATVEKTKTNEALPKIGPVTCKAVVK